MSTRLSGPERRLLILKESQRLFAEKGFHGVSIDEIARAVNVSPAILYRHFESKQALYDAVLRELSSQRESYVEAVINSGAGFEEVLVSMTEVFIHSIDENPNLLRIEMQSLLDGNSATSEFFENRWKSFNDYINFSLNELLAYDIDDREIKILTASLMFQGMVREALLQKYLQPQDHLIDVSLNELSRELVTLFVRAVGIDRPRAAETE
ncbi:MAG: TetR/AcrR family transcriptional regulator [Gammaproteobacteria bacterium]|jgi:AcrR family transcriptional regulator|nr:TetR/AcrR family transcriptional regulator [Gammaproteobacteria bacterium]